MGHVYSHPMDKVGFQRTEDPDHTASKSSNAINGDKKTPSIKIESVP